MSVYLPKILDQLPKILSLIDREPFSQTYGCADRLYWCWKFTDFPGARFQECLYTLSWLVTSKSFDNPWLGNQSLHRIIEAGFEYWSRIQYADGSFDEAYPFERSLAAVAFTTFYLTEAYELVGQKLSEPTRKKFLQSLSRAGHWLTKNDEKHGVLSNHLAAAAAACHNAGALLNDVAISQRANHFVNRILSRQSSEGWYEEYGGADIGYQTHATFYLARIWQKSQDQTLLASLQKANRFLSFFVHPDGSLGGEYASRNTMFYFPAGYEMLAGQCSAASAVAWHQRPMIAQSKTVGMEQMDAQNLFPMLNNYIFAHEAAQSCAPAEANLPWQAVGQWHFPQAGFLVKSTSTYYAVIGATKGGVVRSWDKLSRRLASQSSGYVTKIGKVWYSNQAQGCAAYSLQDNELVVDAPFIAINQKKFDPLTFINFRAFNITLGRFPAISYALKRLLVRVLVSRKKPASLRLIRSIQLTDNTISIHDRLTDDRAVVQHIDKFSSFHMGSSRYVHLEEEQIRGTNYDQYVSASCDHRGLLAEATICFSESERGLSVLQRERHYSTGSTRNDREPSRT